MSNINVQQLAMDIIKGKWPETPLTNDQKIWIINHFPNLLVFTRGEPNTISGDQVTNIALWLGGLHRDIQVYAWQLIRRLGGFEIHADDKTAVRLRPIEEQIFQGEPYFANSHEDIVKFSWSREWLDGSDFEDRLDDLVDEFCFVELHEMVTPDMILSGIHRESINDVATVYTLVVGCVAEIGQISDFRRQEKIDRFSDWLDFQTAETKILGQKMLENLPTLD